MQIFLDDVDLLNELKNDVRSGLSAQPRWLSPRWFYDERGSALFDQITRLPEYYLTRAETEILELHAANIAAITGRVSLAELGSGYSTKTVLILDALNDSDALHSIVTLDVSAPALEYATKQLNDRYVDVPVYPIVGDYSQHLHRLPEFEQVPRMLVFLGSTIGNLTPSERRSFLDNCQSVLKPGEYFLVGTDLVKDSSVLEAAYDDDQGVTAEFNLNVLRVIQQRLGAELVLDDFRHEAYWEAEHSWVQVALRAVRDTEIVVPNLVRTALSSGDKILTEISSKFTPKSFDLELASSGFSVSERWFDSQNQFALTLAQRV